MTQFKLMTIVVVVSLAMGAAGGYTFNEYRRDSIDLAIKNAAEDIKQADRERDSEVAAAVETKLKGLRANERVIERHTKEVVERPVYGVDCIDADGVRIIDSIATSGTTEPSD